MFDEFYVIADDPIYLKPFRSVLPRELSEKMIGSHSYQYLANGKLSRKGNDETAVAGTDLALVPWQDIWYIIGASIGLENYEL
jgi:hypothetical protein